MKKFLMPSVLLLIVGAIPTGCCHSLACNAKKVASQSIQCKEPMKIKNMTSEVKKSPDSSERYIKVEGCGQQVTLVCHPTNEHKQIKKKYREDVVLRQNRLELKWKCQKAGQLTLKNKAIPGSGA